MRKSSDSLNSDQDARREFIERRKRCIGGSDAPAILGVNPFKTPYFVWLEKVGFELPDQGSEAAFWGSYLEDPVARHALDQIRLKYPNARMRREPRLLLRKDYPFIGGNVDRRIILDKSGNQAVLEVKLRNAYTRDQFVKSLPEDLTIQSLHYQQLDERFVGSFVATLIGGNKFVMRWLARDEDRLTEIREPEIRFWQDYVVTQTPPPITGTDTDRSLLHFVYGQETTGETVALDPNIADDLIEQYRTAKEAEAMMKQLKDEAANRLKLLIGAADGGICGHDHVRVVRFKKHKFDMEAFEKSHPELKAEFTAENSESRINVSEFKLPKRRTA